MKKYLCEACGYIYDPEVGDPDNGVEAGTGFLDIPESIHWTGYVHCADLEKTHLLKQNNA